MGVGASGFNKLKPLFCLRPHCIELPCLFPETSCFPAEVLFFPGCADTGSIVFFLDRHSPHALFLIWKTSQGAGEGGSKPWSRWKPQKALRQDLPTCLLLYQSLFELHVPRCKVEMLLGVVVSVTSVLGG